MKPKRKKKIAPGRGRKPEGRTSKLTLRVTPACEAAIRADLAGPGDTLGKVVERRFLSQNA